MYVGGADGGHFENGYITIRQQSSNFNEDLLYRFLRCFQTERSVKRPRKNDLCCCMHYALTHG